MSYLNLKTFLRSSSYFFGLHGVTLNKKDVPCRIKVGTKRVLDVYVKPNNFTLDFWGLRDKKPVYLHNYPVPVTHDEEGVLFFDATSFLKKYLGKNYSECSEEAYRRAKSDLLRPCFIKATEYGVATDLISWTDIMPLVYSYVYLSPGALTICGKPVQLISWESASEADAASGDKILPLVEKLLSGPHDLSKEDVLKALEDVGGLDYNFISILTDGGSYNMYALWSYNSSVDLPGEYVYFTPEWYDAAELTKICLTLMECTNSREVETSITHMMEDGLIANSCLDE